MKPIARDTSDFPKLHRNGCIYVDKTAWFHRLLTDPGANCFFLARPRRFGKSLMISTFKAIFQGRRDLFDGLAISKTDWAWEKHPVLHFNRNSPALGLWPSAGEFRVNERTNQDFKEPT